MLAIEWNLATIVLMAAIVSLVVLAVRRLVRRGTCDCHDHDSGSASRAGGCSGCSGCGAADKMVADIQRAATSQR